MLREPLFRPLARSTAYSPTSSGRCAEQYDWLRCGHASAPPAKSSSRSRTAGSPSSRRTVLGVLVGACPCCEARPGCSGPARAWLVYGLLTGTASDETGASSTAGGKSATKTAKPATRSRRRGLPPRRRRRAPPRSSGAWHLASVVPRRRETQFLGRGARTVRLSVIWRTKIGSGPTQRKPDNQTEYWSGTGWTGQPTLVRDRGRDWLLIGGYDHNLHRIDVKTGRVMWEAEWPDVMKGTNTVVANPKPTSEASRIIVVSGSRRGSSLGRRQAYRPAARGLVRDGQGTLAASRAEDRELQPRRGLEPAVVQGRALRSGGVGLRVRSRPVPDASRKRSAPAGRARPLAQALRQSDVARHPDVGGANLAVEASPSAIGDVIYITAGSGHVYGLDRGR